MKRFFIKISYIFTLVINNNILLILLVDFYKKNNLKKIKIYNLLNLYY